MPVWILHNKVQNQRMDLINMSASDYLNHNKTHTNAHTPAMWFSTVTATHATAKALSGTSASRGSAETDPRLLFVAKMNAGRRSEWHPTCRNSVSRHFRSGPARVAERQRHTVMQATFYCSISDKNKGSHNHNLACCNPRILLLLSCFKFLKDTGAFGFAGLCSG